MVSLKENGKEKDYNIKLNVFDLKKKKCNEINLIN